MAFNSQEQEIIRAGIASGKSKQDIISALSSYRTGASSMPTQTAANPIKAPWYPTSIGETFQDAMQIMPNVGTSGFNAYSRSMDVLENPNFNPAQKFMGVAGASMMGASNMIGDVVLGIGKMGISQEKEDEIKQIVGDVATKVIDTPQAESILKWYKGLDEDDKLFVDSTGGALSFMLDVGTFGVGKAITEPAKKLLSEATKLPGKGWDAGVNRLRRIGRDGGGPPPPPPPPAGQLAVPAANGITDAVGEAGAKATSNVPTGGVTGALGEFVERIPRAIARGVDAYDEAATRAATLRASSPVVQQGIKSGLADDIINFTQTADEATTADARKMLDIAESTPTNLVPKQSPGDIAGQAAAKQYQIVEAQRRAVGQKIGDLTDDLAKQGVQVDMKPAYRQATDILRANGMLPKVNGTIKFTTKKYTPQQQDVIQKLYNLAMQEKVMSPTQVHEMDQLFSKLQRELLENGKVSDVYVKTPSSKGVVDINIFKVFREIFSEHLASLSPELKLANAEYRKYKNIVDDIEATLIKKGNLKTNADVNPAEYARTSLRRIFSDATSAADYKAIYNKLDKLSRELGYKGSRADTLSLLASKLRKLYPETIPENSFPGGIATGVQTGLRGLGMMDLAEKVLKTGAPDIRDQQKALRALLEDRANFGFTPKEAPTPKKSKTPTAKSEPESSVKDTTGEVPEEQIVETAKKIERKLRNNPQGGYFDIATMIKDLFRIGKKKTKSESKMDKTFRRQDEEYWKSKGYRTTGDGRIERNNRSRGMANFGAMAEDIGNLFKSKANDFQVGLSPVKGAVRGKWDDLVDEADAAFAKGDTATAGKIYDRITTEAQTVVQKMFKRAGIPIKFRGTGYGVYQGSPEPNLDFVATVKPDQEDLFHVVLSDLSQNDLAQHSVLTYKQEPMGSDVKYGIVDAERGISVEPMLTFRPAQKMSLADVAKVNKALDEAGLKAMSIKEGGDRVDILNLTPYNSNYEKFIQQIATFQKNLGREGVLGSTERGRARARFIGDKESGATSTYERNRGDFYAKNKSFAKPTEIESKVLEAVKYKPTVSKKELESLVRSGDVSPTEKVVFQSVLKEMGDKPVKTIEVQSRLRGKMLTLEPKESDSYVSYGWDSIYAGKGFDYKGKAVVFDSNFKHGKGQNHYNAEGLFGHGRYAVTNEDGVKVATIGELQSDVFQHGGNIDHIKNFISKELTELNGRVNEYSRIVRENPNDATAKQRLADFEKQRNEIIDLNAQKDPDILQEQFLNFSRSNQYRQRLLEETIDYAMKTDKPEVIRIAKPSMVAKIEGYVGDADSAAPYELHGGGFGQNAENLSPGDEIGYMGEEWTVVGIEYQGRGWGGPPPSEIVAAPAENVTKFRLSEHIDGEVEYRMGELESILRANKIEKDSDLLDEKVLQEITDDAPWPLDKEADQYLANIDNPDRKPYTRANFIEDAEERVREKISENVWDDLRDIYGEDKVFSADDSYDPTVYVITDDAQVERFGQPSSYRDDLNPIDLDSDITLVDGSAQEVLKGYVELGRKIIPKYEKKIGQKMVEGEMELNYDYGSVGYWEFKPDYSRQTPKKSTF